MKEIIYLDTGVLHSYIAQYSGGLPNSSSHEQTQEVKDSYEQNEGYNSRSSIRAIINSGKVEIPLIFSTPEGTIEGVFQPGKLASEKAIMSQTESGKEIISKQLHDNALEEFEGYLSDKELIHNLTDEEIEGKFIKITSSFKIIDFVYLQKIIQPDKLTELMFKNEQDEIEKMKNENHKTTDAKLKASQKALIQQIQNKLKQQHVHYKDLFTFFDKSLNYLNDILPTNSFIKMNTVIAPLKENYLRENTSELMFKYGGNTKVTATMIAKVTSKITSVEIPNIEKEPLFEFPKILVGVLNPLGVIDQGDVVVSPIAIYF